MIDTVAVGKIPKVGCCGACLPKELLAQLINLFFPMIFLWPCDVVTRLGEVFDWRVNDFRLNPNKAIFIQETGLTEILAGLATLNPWPYLSKDQGFGHIYPRIKDCFESKARGFLENEFVLCNKDIVIFLSVLSRI